MKQSRLENYIEVATVLAKNSHDTKTQVGALLVHKKTNAILSTGYNGYVRGACEDELPNGDDDLKHEYMRHAEENLISNAAFHGIRVSNCAVIVTLSPCKRCLRFLWNSGIDTIYFPKEATYKDFGYSCTMGDVNITIIESGLKHVKLELNGKEDNGN